MLLVEILKYVIESCLQIRTEEMDLIAERGIAAHYSGKVLINGLVGHAVPHSRSSRGKTVCLNNANIALRVSSLPLMFVLFCQSFRGLNMLHPFT